MIYTTKPWYIYSITYQTQYVVVKTALFYSLLKLLKNKAYFLLHNSHYKNNKDLLYLVPGFSYEEFHATIELFVNTLNKLNTSTHNTLHKHNQFICFYL